MAINDAKFQSLKTIVNNSNFISIGDLEEAYLYSLTSPFWGTITDMWMYYLYNQGYTDIAYQDRLNKFLTSLGYTGGLSDKLNSYWINGGNWYDAVAYQDLSAIADFNRNLYALPALGPELVINGNFSDGSNNWVITNFTMAAMAWRAP